MKKRQYPLIGCIATCFCFFCATLTGSFSDLTNEPVINDDVIMEKQILNSNHTGVPTIVITSTPIPTITPIPTASLIPTATSAPTPTASPIPTVTSTPTPTATPIPTMTSTPTNTYTLTFTIPAITSNLNIRSGPSTNHSIIGKLPPESIAYILGEENGWLKISTGSIKEGYISCDYVFTEEEVKELCDSEKLVSATITASILNVRSGPGTHYDIVEKLPKNKTCTVLLSESFDNWLAVELTNNKIGYISTEYAKLSYDLKQGQTLAEIKEKEQQDKMNAALAKANVTNVSNTNRTPMSMTDDQIYLFATVVYNEAGDQSYEGMLAVANVILNRIESKKWGSTLESVLYAKNQFVGAKQKYIERTQKRGIPDICYKAVKEALNGHNNIGDFLYFQMKNSANFSSFSKYYILEDHVFYKLK